METANALAAFVNRPQVVEINRRLPGFIRHKKTRSAFAKAGLISHALAAFITRPQADVQIGALHHKYTPVGLGVKTLTLMKSQLHERGSASKADLLFVHCKSRLPEGHFHVTQGPLFNAVADIAS